TQRQPAPAKRADNKRRSTIYVHTKEHRLSRSREHSGTVTGDSERCGSTQLGAGGRAGQICEWRWSNDHLHWTTNPGGEFQSVASVDCARGVARISAAKAGRKRRDYGRKI